MLDNLENFDFPKTIEKKYTFKEMLGSGAFAAVGLYIGPNQKEHAIKFRFGKEDNPAKAIIQKYYPTWQFTSIQIKNETWQVEIAPMLGKNIIDSVHNREIENLTLVERNAYIIDILHAMAKLHNWSIMHQDIKGENIVLQREGKKFSAAIIDLDMAQKLQDNLNQLFSFEGNEKAIEKGTMGDLPREVFEGYANTSRDISALAGALLKLLNVKNPHVLKTSKNPIAKYDFTGLLKNITFPKNTTEKQKETITDSIESALRLMEHENWHIRLDVNGLLRFFIDLQQALFELEQDNPDQDKVQKRLNSCVVISCRLSLAEADHWNYFVPSTVKEQTIYFEAKSEVGNKYFELNQENLQILQEQLSENVLKFFEARNALNKEILKQEIDLNAVTSYAEFFANALLFYYQSTKYNDVKAFAELVNLFDKQDQIKDLINFAKEIQEPLEMMQQYIIATTKLHECSEIKDLNSWLLNKIEKKQADNTITKLLIATFYEDPQAYLDALQQAAKILALTVFKHNTDKQALFQQIINTHLQFHREQKDPDNATITALLWQSDQLCTKDEDKTNEWQRRLEQDLLDELGNNDKDIEKCNILLWSKTPEKITQRMLEKAIEKSNELISKYSKIKLDDKNIFIKKCNKLKNKLLNMKLIEYQKLFNNLKTEPEQNLIIEENTKLLPDKFSFDAIDYTFVKKLGEGGYGIVYQYKGSNGKDCAIKVKKSSLEEINPLEEEVLKRYVDDYKTTELEIEDKKVSIQIMPMLGEDLTLFALDNLSFIDRVKLIQSILLDVARFHNRTPKDPTLILNQDIKPENVLTKNKEGNLIDFGTATNVRFSRAVHENNTLQGTPIYLSPEHAKKLQSLSNDIHNLLSVFLPIMGASNPTKDKLNVDNVDFDTSYIPFSFEGLCDFSMPDGLNEEQQNKIKTDINDLFWRMQGFKNTGEESNWHERPSTNQLLRFFTNLFQALKMSAHQDARNYADEISACLFRCHCIANNADFAEADDVSYFLKKFQAEGYDLVVMTEEQKNLPLEMGKIYLTLDKNQITHYSVKTKTGEARQVLLKKPLPVNQSFNKEKELLGLSRYDYLGLKNAIIDAVHNDKNINKKEKIESKPRILEQHLLKVKIEAAFKRRRNCLSFDKQKQYSDETLEKYAEIFAQLLEYKHAVSIQTGEQKIIAEQAFLTAFNKHWLVLDEMQQFASELKEPIDSLEIFANSLADDPLFKMRNKFYKEIAKASLEPSQSTEIPLLDEVELEKQKEGGNVFLLGALQDQILKDYNIYIYEKGNEFRYKTKKDNIVYDEKLNEEIDLLVYDDKISKNDIKYNKLHLYVRNDQDENHKIFIMYKSPEKIDKNQIVLAKKGETITAYFCLDGKNIESKEIIIRQSLKSGENYAELMEFQNGGNDKKELEKAKNNELFNYIVFQTGYDYLTYDLQLIEAFNAASINDLQITEQTKIPTLFKLNNKYICYGLNKNGEAVFTEFKKNNILDKIKFSAKAILLSKNTNVEVYEALGSAHIYQEIWYKTKKNNALISKKLAINNVNKNDLENFNLIKTAIEQKNLSSLVESKEKITEQAFKEKDIYDYKWFESLSSNLVQKIKYNTLELSEEEKDKIVRLTFQKSINNFNKANLGKVNVEQYIDPLINKIKNFSSKNLDKHESYKAKLLAQIACLEAYYELYNSKLNVRITGNEEQIDLMQKYRSALLEVLAKELAECYLALKKETPSDAGKNAFSQEKLEIYHFRNENIERESYLDNASKVNYEKFSSRINDNQINPSMASEQSLDTLLKKREEINAAIKMLQDDFDKSTNQLIKNQIADKLVLKYREASAVLENLLTAKNVINKISKENINSPDAQMRAYNNLSNEYQRSKDEIHYYSKEAVKLRHVNALQGVINTVAIKTKGILFWKKSNVVDVDLKQFVLRVQAFGKTVLSSADKNSESGDLQNILKFSLTGEFRTMNNDTLIMLDKVLASVKVQQMIESLDEAIKMTEEDNFKNAPRYFTKLLKVAGLAVEKKSEEESRGERNKERNKILMGYLREIYQPVIAMRDSLLEVMQVRGLKCVNQPNSEKISNSVLCKNLNLFKSEALTGFKLYCDQIKEERLSKALPNNSN